MRGDGRGGLMAKGRSQPVRGAAAQAGLRSLRKLGCVAASPESITTAGDHGFRAPSLRSGPGMTSELSNAPPDITLRCAPPHEVEPFILGKHLDTEVLGLAELRAGAGAGDHVVDLLRHRARDLGAQPFRHGFRLVAGRLFERAGEDHSLPPPPVLTTRPF